MSSIKNFVERHPRLAAWIVLAVGFVAILVWSARDQAFSVGQWAALIVATVLLAGACVWIIGWEEDDEAMDEAAGDAVEQPVADQ